MDFTALPYSKPWTH